VRKVVTAFWEFQQQKKRPNVPSGRIFILNSSAFTTFRKREDLAQDPVSEALRLCSQSSAALVNHHIVTSFSFSFSFFHSFFLFFPFFLSWNNKFFQGNQPGNAVVTTTAITSRSTTRVQQGIHLATYRMFLTPTFEGLPELESKLVLVICVKFTGLSTSGSDTYNMAAYFCFLVNVGYFTTGN
jgi:hypothetical protein